MNSIAKRTIGPAPKHAQSDLQAYHDAMATRDAIDAARRANDALMLALRRDASDRLGYMRVMNDDEMRRVIAHELAKEIG
jgi:hypothetical protein